MTFFIFLDGRPYSEQPSKAAAWAEIRRLRVSGVSGTWAVSEVRAQDRITTYREQMKGTI